jgi:Gas vesicle synthesis protein GvpO
MAPQRRRSRSAADEEQATGERQQTGQSAVRRKPAAEEEPAAETPADADTDTDTDTKADAEPAQDGQHPNGRVRTARDAAKAALCQILELTDKQPESITGVQRMPDGWSVCFEVVEDRRIPSSADILATYESTVDSDGELMSFRRVKRYSRGRGDGS